MRRKSLADVAVPGARARGGGDPDTARARRVVPVEVATVREGRRRRRVDADAVAMLADSMSAIGLQAPIVVRADPGDRGALLLVAGSHRLAAARRLGWSRIDALVAAGDDDELSLVEIDENLVRAELRPLERALFLVARREIHRRLHPGPRPGRRPAGGETCANIAPVSFGAEAGRLTGLSRRGVYRALEIGEGLHPPLADALAETPVATREGDLHRISRKGVGEQKRLLAALRGAGEAPRTLAELERGRAGKPGGPAAGAEARMAALKRAWKAAGPAERAAFLAWTERDGGRDRRKGTGGTS